MLVRHLARAGTALVLLAVGACTSTSSGERSAVPAAQRPPSVAAASTPAPTPASATPAVRPTPGPPAADGPAGRFAQMPAPLSGPLRGDRGPRSRQPARVPRRASGRLVRVALPPSPHVRGGRPIRYRLEVERGLPIDRAAAGRTVVSVLADWRGWRTRARVRFVPARPGQRADITVTIASPALTDRLCAPLLTRGRLSCWNGERAVFNAHRWVFGAATYRGQLDAYRTYLINHEVGHGLGYGHVRCPRRGGTAPVMVQQTKSLGGCTAWPWPLRPTR